jgi:hypothetical protein
MKDESVELKSELLLLYNYITYIDTSDESINKIMEKYGCLPTQIVQDKTISHTNDSFLINIFNSIEYSNNIKYFILNSGRKAITFIAFFMFFISLFTMFILPFFFIAKNVDPTPLKTISFFLIPCSLGLLVLSEEIFKSILITAKNGDIIRILTSKDEVVSISKPYQTIENGKILTKYLSTYMQKKTAICENYIEKFEQINNKNFTNYTIYYLCIDYIINNSINESYRLYLYEKAKNALEYIYAFRRESEFVLFNLSIVNINLLNLDDSLKYIKEYNSIINNNFIINAWKTAIEFNKK